MKTFSSGVSLGLIAILAQIAPLHAAEAETGSQVAKARALAMDYIKELPDFFCTENIHRYVKLTLPKGWHATDNMSVKLAYTGQDEDRQVVRLNGAAVDQPQKSVGGLVNVGEFGGMLESVFDPASAAGFQFDGATTVRGRAVVVYSYKVEKANSHYSLGFDPGGFVHNLVVAYHGSVTIDRETGGVLRLTYEAEGMPADYLMQRAVTAIDYDFVEVGGKRYLLPVKSVVETETEGLPARNVAEFAAYRKYSADSTIRYMTETEKSPIF